MSVITSDIRVTITTPDGVLDVTDDVMQLDVSDGIDTIPQGSFQLPLRRDESKRRLYLKLIPAYALVKIEMLSFDATGKGDWAVVLHGRVMDVQVTDGITENGISKTTNVECSGFAGILNEDFAAWWMHIASIEGWLTVGSKFTPDMQNAEPHRVAFDFLTRVGMYRSNWAGYGFTIDQLIHLDFNGLAAIAVLEMNLTQQQGAPLSIVRGTLDPPIHELVFTTGRKPTPSGPNSRVQYATRPANDNTGEASIIQYRPAPYPYANPSGKGVLTDWQNLPVNLIEPVDNGIDVKLSVGDNRTFFMAYPAITFIDEKMMFALGAAIKNENARKLAGIIPLQTRTHLIVNKGVREQALTDFILGLTYRVAGQWNRQAEMLAGSVRTLLNTTVRPGERVRFEFPQGENEMYEFHVKSRRLSWQPERGGSSAFTINRGLPQTTYKNAAWFVEGLEKITVPLDKLNKIRATNT